MEKSEFEKTLIPKLGEWRKKHQIEDWSCDLKLTWEEREELGKLADCEELSSLYLFTEYGGDVVVSDGLIDTEFGYLPLEWQKKASEFVLRAIEEDRKPTCLGEPGPYK